MRRWEALVIEALLDQRLQVGQTIGTGQMNRGAQLGQLGLLRIMPGRFAIVFELSI
ncbi:MAG: hypothetical protein JWQ22_2372, partial [Devosia sp.]|nr:hypothetical protein [Devosia sp.]